MKKTLLFGNGFNMLNTDDHQYSWEKLLIQLGHVKEHKDCQIKTCECKPNDKQTDNCSCFHKVEDSLPYTMIYENLFLMKKELSEEKLKETIANTLRPISSNEFYIEAINSEFDHYITTNYDHAFQQAIQKMDHYISEDIDNSEKLYSIRRYNQYTVNQKTIKLWQMHGTIDNPKSIQLGLDHYAGAIGKIDAYIKGNYNHQYKGENRKILSIEEKLTQNITDENISWIDLFFNSNIHIIGLGLDYSEYDLWWILNKRARFMIKYKMPIKNTITYYFAKNIEKSKQNLLTNFDVITKHISALDKNGNIDYKEFTKKALKEASK